ncbi:MAG: putative O-glycosylation ligase, exosortase A system-associated [Magnetococcales bacterium]|nr:putative O-glycosylation ligase, exosortase A system-associated [Magnetococcales bacterium]
MRDLLLTLIIFGSLPLILIRPHYGVYMWAWLTYMTPHRLAWGFAYDFRFNYFVAIVTIIAIIRSKEIKIRLPMVLPLLLWMLFSFWTSLTTILALEPFSARQEWDRFVKIQVLIFITYLIIKEKKQIVTLVGIIAFSIGFFGFKGGLFTIFKGGYFRVMGPEYSFIADNNTFALALNMTLPLSLYFMYSTKKIYIRLALLVHNFFCILAIFGSYSRGGLVALIAMGTIFWVASRKKITTLIFILILAPLAVTMMPNKWIQRVSPMLESLNLPLLTGLLPVNLTQKISLNSSSAFPDEVNFIQLMDFGDGLIKKDAEILQDLSILGRFDAWNLAKTVANDRPFVGGGFGAFTQGVFDRYTPGVFRHDAHSIYFEVLGEQGYMGLLIWVLMHLSSIRSGLWVVMRCRHDPELAWSALMAKMIILGLVGYYSAGISLGLAYYDLPYHYLCLLVILSVHVKSKIRIRNEEERLHGKNQGRGHTFPVQWPAGTTLPGIA